MRKCGWLIFYCYIVAVSAHAGVPQIIHPETGETIVREDFENIIVTIDQGPLGSLSNAQAVALVSRMLDVWNDIPQSRLHLSIGGQLSEDVTADNVADYVDGSVCSDEHPATNASMRRGESPIIFDHDGSIIDLLSGEGASRTIAGKAAFRCYRGSLHDPQTATQSFMVINGRFFDQLDEPVDLSLSVFAGIILHELGHFLGLHHSVVNADLFREMLIGQLSLDASRYIPVMYPLVLRNGRASTVPTPDDVAAVRAMAPADDFNPVLFTGAVYDADGFGVRGANVIAREQSDPRCQAVSAVSGRHCVPLVDENEFVSLLGEACRGSEAEQGSYRINGLNAGSYTIEVSSIPQTGGAARNVFPKSLDKTLPGPAEFYHVDDQSNEAQNAGDVIRVSAGDHATALDVHLASAETGAAQPDLAQLASWSLHDTTDCALDHIDFDALIAAAGGAVRDTDDLQQEATGASVVTTDTSLAALESGGCSLRPVQQSPIAPIGLYFVIGACGMFALRSRRIRRGGIMMCVLAIHASSAWATSAIPVTQSDLAKHAGTVFYGTCIDQVQYRDEHGFVVRELHYDVIRSVKGAAQAGRTFVFKMPISAIDSVQCTPGESQVLFVHNESAWGYAAPVGGAQGQFDVQISSGGDAYVVPSDSHVHHRGTKSLSVTTRVNPHDLLDAIAHSLQQQAP